MEESIHDPFLGCPEAERIGGHSRATPIPELNGMDSMHTLPDVLAMRSNEVREPRVYDQLCVCLMRALTTRTRRQDRGMKTDTP
jgi:hypothetical protein